MYLIVIAWLYVTVMMTVAEASAPNGSLLGAAITFILYGLLPCAILVYILDTPERKRRLRARRQHEQQQWDAAQATAAAATELPPSDAGAPDRSGHAPGAAQNAGIAAVREET